MHYLFYSLKQFDVHTFKTNNIYAIKNLSINAKTTPVYFGNAEERNRIAQIDPVELLTILIKNTDAKYHDEKDIYGYTPLHYAALRGSTISYSMLVSRGCNYLSRSLIANASDFIADKDPAKVGNTPLSTAIFFKRESCVLAFLRSIEQQNRAFDQAMVMQIDTFKCC